MSFAEGQLVSACKHGQNTIYPSDYVWGVGCSYVFAVCTYSGMLLERFSDVPECLLCFRPILHGEGEEKKD